MVHRVTWNNNLQYIVKVVVYSAQKQHKFHTTMHSYNGKQYCSRDNSAISRLAPYQHHISDMTKWRSECSIDMTVVMTSS